MYEQIFSILAVLGVIAVSAFVIIFFVDLILSIVDGKGLFKNTKTSYDPDLVKRPVVEDATGNEVGTGRKFEPRDEVTNNIYINNAQPVLSNAGQEINESEAEREARLIAERASKMTAEKKEEPKQEVKKDVKQETKKDDFFNFDDDEEDDDFFKQVTDKKQPVKKDVKPVVEIDDEDEDFEDEDEDDEDMDERRKKVLEILNRISGGGNKNKTDDESLIADIARKSVSEIIEDKQESKKDEIEKLKAEINELKDKIKGEAKESGKNSEEVANLKAEKDAMEAKIADEKAEIDKLRAALKAEQAEVAKEREELKKLEKQANELASESQRLIVTDISVLSADERLKLKNRYEANLETLRERLRINERQLKLNNKDYIPLRRVKNSLERDKKQLRRREAIVAKQQVLVYGVNNKMNLDPERIKKLEEDTQQLEGLQKSVTSCEEIMYRNRDRYPTLENMYNILTTQGKNIKADIEELEARIAELGKIEMDNTVILDNKNDEEN